MLGFAVSARPEVIATVDKSTAYHFGVGAVIGIGMNSIVNLASPEHDNFKRYGYPIIAGTFVGTLKEVSDQSFDIIDLSATILGSALGAYTSNRFWVWTHNNTVMIGITSKY
jgi:hypothetical protein